MSDRLERTHFPPPAAPPRGVSPPRGTPGPRAGDAAAGSGDRAEGVGAPPDAAAIYRSEATGSVARSADARPSPATRPAETAQDAAPAGRARPAARAGDPISRAFESVFATLDRAVEETVLAAFSRPRPAAGGWMARLPIADAPVTALLQAAADYLAAGSAALAVEMTRQAVALSPDHPDVLAAHARAAAAAGLAGEARAAKEAADQAARPGDGDVRADLRQVASLLRSEGAARASHMPAFLYSAAADLERLLGVGPGRAAVGRADEQEWAARSLSQRFVAALIGSQEQAVAAARRSLESGAGNAAGWSWGIVAALGAHALMPPMPDLSTGSLSAFVGFGVTLGAGIAAGRAVRARVRSRVRDALDRRAAHLARLSELRARLETPLA